MQDSQGRQLAVIFLFSLLCYLNSLVCDFAYDDFRAITLNRDVLPSTPVCSIFANDFWGTPMTHSSSHGSYRPITVASFRLNYLFFRFIAVGYHLTNVILHVVVSLLVFWTLRALLFSSSSAYVAALLFAVHPVHVEAVTVVIGRAELLSALFFFLALIFYVASCRRQPPVRAIFLLGAIICIPVATLCKEIGITVAGVIIFYEIVVQAKWNPRAPIESLKGVRNASSVLRLSSVFVATVAFILFRLIMMPRLPNFSSSENPAFHAPTPIKQLSLAYLVPMNARVLIHPWQLMNDWSGGLTIPLINGWTDWRNFVTLLFFGALILATIRSLKDRQLILGLAFIVVPFIPSSNLFFPVGFTLAERVLYLPSFGWCTLIAVGFERLLLRLSSTAPNVKKTASSSTNCSIICCFLLFAVTLAAFLGRTFIRNLEWTDDITLYRSSLKYSENTAKTYLDIGRAFERQNDLDKAFAFYYRAVKLDPKYSPCYRDVIRVLDRLKLKNLRLRAVRRLVRLLPDDAQTAQSIDEGVLMACADLASHLANSTDHGQLIEAESLFALVNDFYQSEYPSGYLTRGEILYKLGRYKEARSQFDIAMKLSGKNCGHCFYAKAITDVGETPDDDKKLLAALEDLQQAVAIDNEHFYAMHAYGAIVQRKKLAKFYDRAYGYLKEVVEFEQNGNLTISRKTGSAITLPESVVPIWDPSLIALLLETEIGNSTEVLDLIVLSDQPKLSPALISSLLDFDPSLSTKVITRLEKLLEQHPTAHLNAWTLLGQLHMNFTQNSEKARLAFEKVVQYGSRNATVEDPTVFTAKIGLCQVNRQVAACLQQLADQYPGSPLITKELESLKKLNAK